MFEGIKAAMNKVWGRKTFITLICLICGTLVDIFGKTGLSVNYMTLLGTLAGAFAVGNGMEHMANRRANAAPDSQPVEPMEMTPPSNAAIESIQQSQAGILQTLDYIMHAVNIHPSQMNKDSTPVNPQAAKNRQAIDSQQ